MEMKMPMVHLPQQNVLLIFSVIALWVGESLGQCDEAALRLVGARSAHCGRVEICHNNMWGTICDDGWDDREATVVCKQLGYETYERRFLGGHDFGEGNGPIWLANLRCRDYYTHITQCGNPLSWGEHNCGHDEDAGVCCRRTEAPKPDSLPVRLTCPPGCSCNTCPDELDGTVSGIVEVEVDGEWGPISSVYWTPNASKVFCGQLGYPVAIPQHEVITDVNITCEQSSGIGMIEPQMYLYTLLKELECSGVESELKQCFFSGIGYQPNPSDTVAAAMCGFKHSPNTELVRLKGGAVPWKGRVEIFVNNEWGSVCDTGFNVLQSNVICRQLGYGVVQNIYTRATMGRGIGRVHYTQCRCKGTEAKLTECNCLTDEYAEACGHDGDVGVVCGVPKEDPECHIKDVKLSMYEYTALYWWNSNTYPEVHIRNTLVPNAVVYNNGLLCDSVVTIQVGEVMCRESKEQFLAMLISTVIQPEDYNGFFYNGEIICNGTESSLSDCTFRVYLVGRCSKYTAIRCSPVAPDLVPDADVLEHSLISRYFVERLPLYHLTCAIEEKCLSSSAEGAHDYDERKLLKFDSLAWNLGTYDFKPALDNSQWEWHDCHLHYHAMEEFVHYDLFNETNQKVAEGHKASFCLTDSICKNDYPSRYVGCGRNVYQGISVNCADLYSSSLDCQWIDITNVPPGSYIMRINLNPNHVVVETDYTNNMAFCRITIKERIFDKAWYMTDVDCWNSGY